MTKHSSPYLKLINSTDVNWFFALDEELQTKARKENKLLFIHIGYMGSVINREFSLKLFYNLEISEILNRNFISIAVDREEKPETFALGIDMLLLENDFSTGPINIFALPNGTPILAFSNTFPENFLQLSQNLIIATNKDYSRLELMAKHFCESLVNSGVVTRVPEKDLISEENLLEYYSKWRDIDIKNFQFNNLKPYTLNPNLDYLLSIVEEYPDKDLKNGISQYLEHLQYSKAFDVISGGFFRQTMDYSCDKPLFEKTLIENSLFLKFYAHASNTYSNSEFKLTAEKIFSFIKSELTSASDGLYNCTTLLTNFSESYYYHFTKNEINRLFKENSGIILKSLSIDSDSGDNEKILPKRDENSYKRLNDEDLKILSTRRDEHLGFFVDKRKITAFNAAALNNIAIASQLLNNAEMLNFAMFYFENLRNDIIDGDKMIWRCRCENKKEYPASLSDYAYFIQLLLTIYSIDKKHERINLAKSLIDKCIDLFYNNLTGMFFKTAENENIFLYRRESIMDYSVPAVNSIMADNLITISEYIDSDEYLIIAKKQINNIVPDLIESGQQLLSWSYQMLRILNKKR